MRAGPYGMSAIFGILADVRTVRDPRPDRGTRPIRNASDDRDTGTARASGATRLLSALAGLLLVLPVAACGLVESGPSPKDVATAYLNAFAAGDNVAAAQRTDKPKAARELLDTTRERLSPKAVHTEVTDVGEQSGGRAATAKFTVSWDLGKGRVWRYDGSLKLEQADKVGWRVHWAPSVIHPKLGAQQTLDFAVDEPRPAPVEDRNGVRLMGPEKLVRVTLAPKAAGDVASVAGSLASGLKKVAPGVTKKGIMDGVAATPDGQAYTVVLLRRSDYEAVKPAIYDLPGVRFPTTTESVTKKQDYASQVLPSLADKLGDRIDGTSGWRVFTRNAAGVEVTTLHSVRPKPAKSVTTTLSDRVQSAAEKAIDPLKNAAMIVAMKPSNGDILAVAQNAAADKSGAVALTGQYPPGSTFKTVTALAGVEAGKVDINTPLPCPAKTKIHGKVLPNAHDFKLGTVPLRTAFAKSCNTTFAQLSVGLPPDALPKAAKKLGIGADFVVPGITTITGEVPTAKDRVQRAVNGIGQGSVLASPFGMALMTASVADGGTVTPKLVQGRKTETKSAARPPSRRSVEQVRAMMREVVKSGTATELAGSGKVAGKTGTAQFGDGTHAHGWFVGYRGDLAFAVLITDAGTSDRAVNVARSFLANTQ